MKYLICNLKAHKTYDEMLNYQKEISKINSNNIKLILAPSSIYLPLFINSNINLCAQNISLYDNLNLTGDITINQLKNLNVKYAIIGHVERRKYYKETEHEILTKIKTAIANNLTVIYCIGETTQEAMRRVEYQVLERQIAKIFNKIENNDLKKIIIAYEPEYLIGKTINYDYNKIIMTTNFIKTLIKDYYNVNIPIIFGGSINKDNIDNLLTNNIDGFIVCSSILNPNNISEMINKIATR